MLHFRLLTLVRVALLTLIATSPCATAGEGQHAATAAKGPPSHVVVIVSDDQAWGDYGFMGHKQVRTPHLDKLASQSLTFRRGYVPGSLCRPSLMTIITGLYPHQHKITSNDPPIPKGKRSGEGDATFLKQRQEQIAYIDKVDTLPKTLGKAGYVSFQTGKWWEGNFQRGGFTHGMTDGQRHGDKGLDIGRKTMQPMYDFVQQARSDGKPFFLWYAPMLPHTPHNPPERLLEKYRDKSPSLHVAKYWAMIEWFDETCGDLLKYLDDHKLSENTLVVYVTDNGWIQNENAPNYAAKSKQSQYDGGLRTPIMLRWPGRITPGVSDDLASSIDLVPTILHALSLPVPADRQGINLLDVSARQKRDTLFGECFTHNAVDIHNPGSSVKFRWVIEKTLKLIIPDTRNVPSEQVELYDLAADPYETKNLAAERDRDVQRLREKLDGWWSVPK